MQGLPEGVPTSQDPLDLVASRRDLWPRDTLTVRDHGALPMPGAVLWPETDRQVAEILEAASRRRTEVVPWGAGSGVCGAARARDGAWMMDLKRFDRIEPVDEETWTVEVGAGVNGQRLEDALAARGWAMGHSPSSIGCSTVGGWLAARGAGQFSSAYGVFEDIVVGVDGVSPGRGSFYAGLPGPRSTGERWSPELFDLLIGSEGTLGVITRLRLRVRPLPALRVLRGWRFPDVATATAAMRALMQGETWPFALRLYDPVDTLIGGKTRPHKARAAGHQAWHQGLLQALEARHPDMVRHELALPFALPRLINKVAGALSGGCLLIAGWEGPRDVVAAKERAARPILARHGRDLGPEAGERWYASRHAVSYKLMPIVLRGGFVDTMEVAAPWSVIPRLWTKVREAVADRAVVMAHFSHAYPEGGSIYFSFAGRGDRSSYDATWRAAGEAVLRAGAAVSHHHGIGVLKRAAATQVVGPAIEGFREACAAMDPDGVLNPGVLFDPSLAPKPPVAAPTLAYEDGLVSVRRGQRPCDLPQEVRWPWDRLPGPARASRNPWECVWVGVGGRLGGQRVEIGRGPREAVGPDLRRYVWTHAEDPQAWVGVVREGPRWMGRARIAEPWRVVRDLLRRGLRPGIVGVEGGWLHVGFRGPAALDLGGIASGLVPGGLEPVPWRVLPRYGGPMTPCDPGDRRAVAATEQHVWRPEEGA